MSELVIQHASPAVWERVVELGSQIFARSEQERQHMFQGWLSAPHDPMFRWENVLVGLLDGEVVAHVSIVPRVLRYGQVELTAGGIGGVYAHPDYRQRGFPTALMHEVIRCMKEAGYHLSLLDGIPRYYDRFGYVTLWRNYTTSFTAREAGLVPDDNAGYHVRPFVQTDLQGILALYEKEWDKRPFGVRRTLDWLRYRLDRVSQDGNPFVYVVEDQYGHLCAYSCGWQIDNRIEVAAENRSATAALLRHTGAVLADQPDTMVKWLDMPDSCASRHAARLCGVNYTTWSSYHGGWRGRFIYTQAALETVQPELIRRLGDMNASVESEDSCVMLCTGKQYIRVPETLWLQLMFGYLDSEDVDEWFAELHNDERMLLKQMFPPVVNGLAGLDWF